MTELSAEKLAELREIAGKATPGPWSAMEYDDYPCDEGVCILGAANTAAGSHMIGYSLPNGRSRDQVESDGAHFAAFDPPTLIQLLDRIAVLEADLAACREALARLSAEKVTVKASKMLAGQVARAKRAEAKLAEIRATVENPHIPREQLRPRLIATLDGQTDESH